MHGFLPFNDRVVKISLHESNQVLILLPFKELGGSTLGLLVMLEAIHRQPSTKLVHLPNPNGIGDVPAEVFDDEVNPLVKHRLTGQACREARLESIPD